MHAADQEAQRQAPEEELQGAGADPSPPVLVEAGGGSGSEGDAAAAAAGEPAAPEDPTATVAVQAAAAVATLDELLPLELSDLQRLPPAGAEAAAELPSPSWLPQEDPQPHLLPGESALELSQQLGALRAPDSPASSAGAWSQPMSGPGSPGALYDAQQHDDGANSAATAAVRLRIFSNPFFAETPGTPGRPTPQPTPVSRPDDSSPRSPAASPPLAVASAPPIGAGAATAELLGSMDEAAPAPMTANSLGEQLAKEGLEEHAAGEAPAAGFAHPVPASLALGTAALALVASPEDVTSSPEPVEMPASPVYGLSPGLWQAASPVDLQPTALASRMDSPPASPQATAGPGSDTRAQQLDLLPRWPLEPAKQALGAQQATSPPQQQQLFLLAARGRAISAAHASLRYAGAMPDSPESPSLDHPSAEGLGTEEPSVAGEGSGPQVDAQRPQPVEAAAAAQPPHAVPAAAVAGPAAAESGQGADNAAAREHAQEGEWDVGWSADPGAAGMVASFAWAAQLPAQQQQQAAEALAEAGGSGRVPDGRVNADLMAALLEAAAASSSSSSAGTEPEASDAAAVAPPGLSNRTRASLADVGVQVDWAPPDEPPTLPATQQLWGPADGDALGMAAVAAGPVVSAAVPAAAGAAGPWPMPAGQASLQWASQARLGSNDDRVAEPRSTAAPAPTTLAAGRTGGAADTHQHAWHAPVSASSAAGVGSLGPPSRLDAGPFHSGTGPAMPWGWRSPAASVSAASGMAPGSVGGRTPQPPRRFGADDEEGAPVPGWAATPSEWLRPAGREGGSALSPSAGRALRGASDATRVPPWIDGGRGSSSGSMAGVVGVAAGRTSTALGTLEPAPPAPTPLGAMPAAAEARASVSVMPRVTSTLTGGGDDDDVVGPATLAMTPDMAGAARQQHERATRARLDGQQYQQVWGGVRRAAAGTPQNLLMLHGQQQHHNSTRLMLQSLQQLNAVTRQTCSEVLTQWEAAKRGA